MLRIGFFVLKSPVTALEKPEVGIFQSNWKGE
jgi:hypothetical protein